uniref:AMP-dependent synthetase/ligase domain-containing protein n=1 Tax=Aplanochytrium stocchinoi TaxID=215587 RepID=A0A7S3PH03_9STRA
MGGLLSKTTVAALAVGGIIYFLLNRKRITGAIFVLIANKVAERTVKKLTSPGAICEVERITVKGEKYSAYKNAPKNLAKLFFDGKRHSKNDFLVFTGKPGYPEKRFTYHQAATDAALLGQAMVAKMGFRQGDNVAILLPNMNENAISLISVTSCGGVAVMLNGWWEGEEIDVYLSDSQSKILIIDEARLNRLGNQRLGKHIAKGLKVILIQKIDEASNYVKPLPLNIYSYEALIKEARSEADAKVLGDPFQFLVDSSEKPIKQTDNAMILYTSGTTGTSKGVMLSHLALTQSVESYNLFLQVIKALKGPPNLQRCDLITGPLFHTSGLLGLFLAFRGGHKLVFFPRWRVDELIDIMIKEKVTYFAGVPTMIGDMISNENFIKNKEKFSFNNLGTGGAKIDPSSINNVNMLFPAASQGTGWGMTETAALGTVIGGPQFLALPQTCGKPHVISEVKIINPDTLEEIKTQDTRGELCLRTPTIMNGYWNRPEETKESFIPGTKWFRTGDIGTRDKNGFYYIVDRIKDIVIRGGENISCSEVEAVGMQLQSVVECAAFGLPDSRLGERLCMAVLPANYSVTEQHIKDHVAKNLAKFKVPSTVFIRKTPLPRNAVGKIVKAKLKEEYSE